MNFIATPSQLAGFFKLEGVKIDAAGRETRRLIADWFPNLITNAGLNHIGSAIGGIAPGSSGSFGDSSVCVSCCRVGSGTNVPTVNDTNLQTHVAGTSAYQGVAHAATAVTPYYHYATMIWRFGTGVATGNLSEVAVANTSGSGTGILFSRALILDGSGNPTTITVLADESLDVTYQLRVYPSLVDVAGSVVIEGVTYNYTKRAADVAGVANLYTGLANAMTMVVYSGAMGTILQNPSGSAYGDGNGNATRVVAAYGNNNLYRDCVSTYNLNDANFNINAIALHGNLGRMQFGLATPIPKDATKKLVLNWRYGPWSRYP